MVAPVVSRGSGSNGGAGFRSRAGIARGAGCQAEQRRGAAIGEPSKLARATATYIPARQP